MSLSLFLSLFLCLPQRFVQASLLRTYVSLDGRVAPLLSLIKTWAKARGINDASEHTLNSFGYTLLLIQFLQTRQPPVLPCLQADRISINGR